MSDDFGKFFDNYTNSQNHIENIQQPPKKEKKVEKETNFSDTYDYSDFNKPNVRDSEAYGLTESSKGFFKGLANGFINLFKPQEVFFPPGLHVTEYEEVTPEKTSFEEKYGEDFKKEYGPEKDFFFKSAMFRAKRDPNIKLEELDPKDNIEKLGLILEAQIKGLDTSIYNKFDEKQIAQIMAAQLEGFSKNELDKIANPDLSAAQMENIRQKMERDKGMDKSTVVTYDPNTRLNVRAQSLDSLINRMQQESLKEAKNNTEILRNNDFIK